MIYLLSPYTSTYHHTQEYRYQVINDIMVSLRRAGWNAYSPVALCHPIATMSGLPGTYTHWKTLCDILINNSRIGFLIKLPGWEESAGVQAELKIFTGRVHKIDLNLHKPEYALKNITDILEELHDDFRAELRLPQ